MGIQVHSAPLRDNFPDHLEQDLTRKGIKHARRERKMKYMTIFINGKQKRVPRPQQIDGLSVDEFIAGNADPIWLHQNEMRELMTPNNEG